ncbi:hypothetical protein BDW74DRAFT_179684 [Aspergillus multicolor]|uniref:uncharacterized protein n=1 Tax=Aspergillus multicolor TaxID=41759 RepID=UPI003CCDDD08
MPVPSTNDAGEYEYGASGPKSASSAELAALALGLGIISGRPRSHSTTPPSSERIVTDSGYRSISPGPRRPSLSRFAASPTAVPLHFRPPPASPSLQRTPFASMASPPAVSPVSPSQSGRRSRPNSLEFKNSREIRPLFLVERLGSSKIEQGQFEEELPSLPSSKSGSSEDLTKLKDENSWERQQVSEHDILGSQQNTPTRATFNAGIPRHLSRKEELGYEFHSPSELLQDAELSSYPDLPPELKAGVLPSVESSEVGVAGKGERSLCLETDLEHLPPLPRSTSSSPNDTDDFVSVNDVQPMTPMQQSSKSLPLDKDIPSLDLHSGPRFADVVHEAMASTPSPYPSAEILPESKAEGYVVEAEAQDDDARTVTGDDVPKLADLSPPRSLTAKECEHAQSTPDPWGFASVVGAAIAANKGLEREHGAPVPGDYPATTPSETDKPGSVVDTTEDEFFDAMSRDEAAENGADERAWEMEMPSGMATPQPVMQHEPFAASNLPTTGLNYAQEEQDRDFKVEPKLLVEQDVATIEEPEQRPIEPVPKSVPKVAMTEEPSEEQAGPVDLTALPTNEVAEEPVPEIVTAEESVKEIEAPDSISLPADKTTEEPLPVPAAEFPETQPEEQGPDAPSTSKKSKRKKKNGKGKSLDLGDQSEGKAPDERPAPESAPVSLLDEADANVLPEQASVADIDQPLSEQETQGNAAIEATAVEEANPPLIKKSPGSEIPVTEPLPAQDTSAPTIDQPASLEKELAIEEVAAEVIPEATESSIAVDPEPTQLELPEEVPAETGLSKKAKKKKKKAAKSIDQSHDIANESVPALNDAMEKAGTTADEVLDKLSREATVATEEEPVEEPAVPMEDVPAERKLGEASDPLDSVDFPEQPTEPGQAHTQDSVAQGSLTVADIAVPFAQTENEELPEASVPGQGDKGEPVQVDDNPLSRKASKKNKKKSKRNSAAEAGPEDEGADVPWSEPAPETSESTPDSEAPGLVNEQSGVEEQKVDFQDDKEILIETPKEDEAPKSEPEPKPEDVVAPLETSGQVSPLEDNQQPDAGTKQQVTDTQVDYTTPGTISEEIANESGSDQLVGNLETNDSEPHVPEQSIEPEAGEPSTTGKKSKNKKKKKKKKQSVSSVAGASLPSDVVDAAVTEPEFQVGTPATETVPDVAIEPEVTVASEGPFTAPAEESTHDMPRDLEQPAEPSDALPEDQTFSEAIPMTAAQKKKAKKDRKKKRQSLMSEEVEPEAQASDPAVEKELTDTPVQDDTQDPEVPRSEIGQAEAVTLVVEDSTPMQPTKDVNEVPEQPNEKATDKVEEQLTDSDGAISAPTVADEPTEAEAEAVGSVLEPRQDTTAAPIPDEPATTETQPSLEPQEGKAAEADAPAVIEEPIEPAGAPLTVNATAVEGTEDTQPTSSKKDKKKKKKKRQSVSVDEPEVEATTEAPLLKEGDGSETADVPVNSVTLGAPAAGDDTTIEKVPEENEVDYSRLEPSTTTEGDKGVEKLDEISVPVEVSPETHLEQESARDTTMPEVPIEATLDDSATPREKDTAPIDDEHTTATPTLPEEPTPEPGQFQEQEQPTEPADLVEQVETSSSKKKNKKKKKKSVSSTSVDEEQPAPASEEPVTEQSAVSEPITERNITAEPEQVATDTADNEPHPSVLESTEPVSESGEPLVEQPAEVHTEPSLSHEQIQNVTAPVEESQDPVPEPAKQEPTEPENQDALPAEELTKAAKKKAKKDKKKRKSVSFVGGESAEQQGQPSEPATPSEQISSPFEPVPGNEPVLEQKDQQTLEEPTMIDTPLDNDREVSADQKSSEDLLKDEHKTNMPEEPVPVIEVEQPEPEATEPSAETTTPEPGLSKKDKKKAKKDKKRQSKLLAPETDNEALISTEPVPETPAKEASLDRNKETQPDTLGADTLTEAPAETALSPAEEDGKDNQSHDTGFHSDNDKYLTWTDNDMSSQVEKEQQQQMAFPVSVSEHKRTDVDNGADEAHVEPTPTTADSDVVGESHQETVLKPSEKPVVEEEGVSKEAEVPSQQVEESQNEAGQENVWEKEVVAEPEKTNEEELTVTTTDTPEGIESQEHEPAPQPTQPEPASQPAADAVAKEPEAEPAVPSKKLSKKQKKKQREAEKVAALQEQEKATELETENAEPVESVKPTIENRFEPTASEQVQHKIIPTEEPTVQEPIDSAHLTDEPIDPVTSEIAQDTVTVPDVSAGTESSWVILDENQQGVYVLEAEEGLSTEPTTSLVRDTTTSPVPEEAVHQTEIKEAPTAEFEPPVAESEIKQGESKETPAEAPREVEPVTEPAPLASHYITTELQSESRDIPDEATMEDQLVTDPVPLPPHDTTTDQQTEAKDDASANTGNPEGPAIGKSKKNKKNKKKAPKSVADVDESAPSPSGEPPMTVPGPTVPAMGTKDQTSETVPLGSIEEQEQTEQVTPEIIHEIEPEVHHSEELAPPPAEGEAPKVEVFEPTPLENTDLKELEIIPQFEAKPSYIEASEPAPSDGTEPKEPEIIPQIEQESFQIEAPELVVPETTGEPEQQPGDLAEDKPAEEPSQLEAPEAVLPDTTKEVGPPLEDFPVDKSTEGPSLIQAPELALPETTREVEQPLEDLSDDNPIEEPLVTPEEPTLSRKESKKKKKAKKQAKEQSQIEETEAGAPTAVDTEAKKDVRSTDTAEAVALPSAEPKEPMQDEPVETTIAPAEEKKELEVSQEESFEEKMKLEEEKMEVLADTGKELDVPREAIEEKENVADEVEKEIAPEEKVPEEELQGEIVEPTAAKNDFDLLVKDRMTDLPGDSTLPEQSVEETVQKEVIETVEPKPEVESAPKSRKLSKKEKRKLKKQAEQQETVVPVEPMEIVEDDVAAPAAAAEVTEESQDAPMPTEPVEALPEISIAEPALVPEPTKDPVHEDILPPPVIESTEPPTEPLKEDDALLSREFSKKEKKKKRKEKLEEPQLERELVEPTVQTEEQTYDKPLEPAEAQESDSTARQDEDTWPAIDWGKEIPEFKESAIPEALIERVGETPEEAARESRAQPMTVTIERDVTTREFHTTSTDSAPQALHHVESAQEKKSEEPKPAPVSGKIASIFPNLERGFFRRPSPSPSPTQSAAQSVKDGAEEETVEQEASRGSAIQVLEAPIAREVELQPEVRGSGYIPSPADDVFGAAAREVPEVKTAIQRPPENFNPKPRQDITLEPVKEDDVFGGTSTRVLPHIKTDLAPERPPKVPREEPRTIEDTIPELGPACELRRSPSIHGRHSNQRLPWSLEESAQARSERDVSPSPLPAIAEQEPERGMGRDGTPRLEMKPEHVLPRPETPVRKFTETALGRRGWPTPERESDDDWEKIQKPSPKSLSPERSPRSGMFKTPEQDKPILRPSRPPSAKSSTHSLRRVVHSASGDLRTAALAASAIEAPVPAPALEEVRQSRAGSPQPPSAPTDLDVSEIPSSSSYDPITDKGKRPLRSMTDVYEGWGETPSSPRSPSRPASVRHRRSMQHLQELEFRLDHLLQENRDLAAARDAAEDKLRIASLARRKSDQALNTRDADLHDREAELEQLQQSVEWFQKEVARLYEENAGLTSTNTALIATHTQEIQTVQQTSAREVEQLRLQNERLSIDLHERIKSEIETALKQENDELRRLREELESARDKVKELQQQISAQINDNVIAFRGEDYFEAACQKLCGHVQQWVLRFSKHSDHRRCRKLIDVKDEKIADRFDNAILDGSDTDIYLADRVRRRDVFMSVVMTMIWEFVFTRYLFGMDREQRQKLKSLEKQLIEVGPRNAIHRWRATTLTLLSRRQAFTKQRDSDTEAVALEIFDVLSRLLPPPTHVESQLLESLRKVLRVAVNLSLEMRTQLAEYIMLPPLQPEYDTNGDLARQVFFNASLMNERSGETTSNDELQAQNAVVRVVLFPLVVKKGNDAGEGDDEVVVCPAQVLVARPGKDKRLHRMTSGDRMSIDASRSVHSIAPSSMNMSMSNVI